MNRLLTWMLCQGNVWWSEWEPDSDLRKCIPVHIKITIVTNSYVSQKILHQTDTCACRNEDCTSYKHINDWKGRTVCLDWSHCYGADLPFIVLLNKTPLNCLNKMHVPYGSWTSLSEEKTILKGPFKCTRNKFLLFKAK